MIKRWIAALMAALLTLSMVILPAGAEGELLPLLEEYANYDFALFTEGEAMASLYERAQAADADAEALLAEDAAIEKKLKNEYPYLVPFAQKKVYAAFTEGVTDWAITCDADWRAAVAANSNFLGETLHLTNNIDLKSENVSPLCPKGLTFQGTLNGHGYCFMNLQMEWDLAKGNYVGLIGYANGATVCEVGLANGLVRAYGKQATEAKVASLIGEGDNVILRHCWSAVNVDSTDGDNNGGQTTSGLARTRGASVIDGCFSVGRVRGVQYSGTLSGYTQGDTKIFNSFAVGTAAGNRISFVRYNADGKVSLCQNSYSVGNNGPYCYANKSVDMSAYELSADAYTSGELAWRLNNGMTGDTATCYTLKDGKTVFGTAENQTRRISMVMEGGETKYAYGSAGEQVELNYAFAATYESDAELVGNLLTVPDGDVTVTVTINEVLDYNALEVALAQYDGIAYEYLVNGEAVRELVEQVRVRLGAGYADQKSIDADVEALNEALVYVSGDRMPSVTLVGSVNAPGYSVSSVEELEFVAANMDLFDLRHILYFTTDLTLPEGSRANKMLNLLASIDGMGHTISGIRVSGDAWLGDYQGAFVKNLHFEDCHATDQPWQGALLIKNLKSPYLVLENLSFENCSASKGNSNGLSIVVGIQQQYNTTEMRNIRVENCTLNRGTMAGNSGFLMGREQCGTLIAEDCYLNNNTLTGTAQGGCGVAFGEITGTASMKNIGIFNTVAEDKPARGALIGTFKNCSSGSGPGILDIENIYSANNGLIGLIYRSNTTGVIRTGNAYSEQEGLLGVDTTGVSARESLVGGAYALNRAGIERLWEFPAGGDAPVWDTDGKGVPAQVTFAAGEVELRYHTDTEGHLVGLTEELFSYADWEGAESLEALKSKTFTEDTVISGTAGTTYRVMSQNLYVGGGNDKKPYMVQRVALYDPDFILMQEGNQPWVDYLTKNLKGYTMYYKYRHVNNLESCPLAWKTDKYEAVEKGYFWISDTPDVESKGWDGACYRITTWAVLRNKATGEQIIISSFHLDHQGQIAKTKGGKVVYDRLLEIRERYPGSVFFTAADFNCYEGTPSYLAMTQENLVDCRYYAERSTARPTFGGGLNGDWSSVTNDRRIDFIMTDSSVARVTEFQVLEETYGNPAVRVSDHNGLLITAISKATEHAYCTHQWTVADNGDGTHQRSCTAGCGFSEQVAHSNRFTKKNGTEHGTTCVYCGAVGTAPCVLEEMVTAPTRTAAGTVNYFCNDCKYSKTVKGDPATGHTYTWNETAADYLCTCGAAHTAKDANGDGRFDTADAAAIMQYLAGMDVSLDLMNADLRRDQRITVADAVAALRLLSA